MTTELSDGKATVDDMNTDWKDVSSDFDGKTGGERWLRDVSDDCYVSVLYRMTGFGYMEWETAIIVRHPVVGRKRTFEDQDLYMIGGDHREALTGLSRQEVLAWREKQVNQLTTFDRAMRVLKDNAQDPRCGEEV